MSGGRAGGVPVHAVHEYIEAGAASLGVRSERVAAELLSAAGDANGDGPLHPLAARAREFLDALRKARHL
jgi:hypothetical protein